MPENRNHLVELGRAWAGAKRRPRGFLAPVAQAS